MATSKRGLWNKIGRYITVVTLACFFLPFFGVSCEGMDVITISGADMVGGCRPGGLIAEAADQQAGRGGGASMKGEVKVDKVEREPLAIAAMLLALAIAGLAWVRKRSALIAVFALSIAGLGAIVGLYVKVGGDLEDAVASELSKKSAGSKMMRETDVDAGSRFGLWFVAAGLIGTAALAGMALREKEGAGPPA